ncbi:MAG: gamma-glutamyl-gamma-aminobutyrate hydrolase family protein [Enterocloster sp.]
MKKPVIGITPSHNTDNDEISLRPTYLRAVKAAEGLPLPLPLEADTEDLAQLAQLCDGFLFSGGPDVHPFLFGEETLAHCGNVSPARDKMELSLLKTAMEAQKPILGICRGIQLINIGLGGDIYQDIASQADCKLSIAHRQPFYYTQPSHHVNIAKGSLLSDITGGILRIEVNSSHHQAVRTPAPGLTPCGYAADGLIEAIEKPDYPFLLGIQWHPEYLWPADKISASLFRRFVEACVKYS